MRRALLAALGAVMLLPAAPATARMTVPHGWMGMVAGTELLAHPSRIPGQFRAMDRAGVQALKAEFAWSRIEPRAGVYAWTAPDAIVANAARRHFSVLPTVVQAPLWAAGPEDGKEFIRHARDPADYAAFMRVLVERYGPKGSFWLAHPELPRTPVRAWEIWNEPELYYYWKPPWRKPYATLLHRAHDAVKAVDPHARIVLAGLTYRSWDFLREIYGEGVRRDFDVVSLHPYTARPKNVVTTMQLVRRVMRGHGDAHKPIWVTELSWTSGKGKTSGSKNQPTFLNSTRAGQAKLLRRAFLALARTRKRYGVDRVYWYTWLTRDRSRTDPFDWSGLLSVKGGRIVAKPALTAYRHVAHRLRRR